MAVKFYIPQAVPLPRPPVIAKFLEPSSERLGKDELQDLTAGELVHVTGGVPDGSTLYAVAAEPHSDASASKAARLREGWLKGSCLEPLSPEEAAIAARLPLRELLQRVTLMRAEEDWSGVDETCLPTLQTGELLQLGAVRDTWAYGWSLEQPSRRGWFPLCLARRLESSVSALVGPEESEELCASSAEAWVELLRNVPQPPPHAFSTVSLQELPPAVAASARQQQQRWEDTFAEINAQEAAMQAAAARALSQGEEASPQTTAEVDIFPAPGTLPDDSFPLFVCKQPFAASKRKTASTANADKALLPLELGDLVRVVSLLDAEMFCGFHDDKPDHRAWFPRRCVEQLEDPLDGVADAAPLGHLGIGPPPLPQVPPSLLRR